MTIPSKSALLFTLLIAVLALGACGGGGGTDQTKTSEETAAKETYPEPRFPAYLRPPEGADAILPFARTLARNTSGFQGKGLGILQPGEAVLIVPTMTAEQIVLDSIAKALEERNVTAHIKFNYELVGVSREDALELHKARVDHSAEQGYLMASQWVEGQFPDPEVPKKWLKERRPDLYEVMFPATRNLSPKMQAVDEKMGREGIGNGIKKYLTEHKDVRGVFWGTGGSTGLRRALFPMQEKFLGTFITDNRWDLMSGMASYPGDVWQLAEEQLLEPLTHAARVEAVDPEGTNIYADLTDEQAQKWARGAYQRGHLYMFPNQATGRFGYSFVDYPAFQGEWLPREPVVLVHGTVAGTSAHAFFPRWEVIFKDGYISEVKGGGYYGEALREFLQYPGLTDLIYPFHNSPGYWYLYEIAFGSHPKAFRHPLEMLEQGTIGQERARSGVIHWGLGIRLWHDPDSPSESQTWIDFTKKHNVPMDHNWHTFTFFTTYRIKLRNTDDRWVNLLDKGRMTSLDDPEVRALASRYGNPDDLLAEDWIPEIPGINAPGDYLKDYAPNSFAYAKQVIEKVVEGTYEHYYPVPTTTAPTSAGTR